jgi:hypothetical protein
VGLIELIAMANWKQIQARIRKARTAPDPVAKLSELYAKTRDAMVAFEAATAAEKLTRSEEAIHWYTTASQRFRRAEWKKRANDALVRLGAPIPADEPAATRTAVPSPHPPIQDPGENYASPAADGQPAIHALPVVVDSHGAEPQEPGNEFPAETQPPSQEVPRTAQTTSQGGAGRRRGRRGGRGRNNRGAAGSSAPASVRQGAARGLPSHLMHETPVASSPAEPLPEPAHQPLEASVSAAVPASQFERMASRSGDPAFASRLGKLESNLRRLMASAAHTLNQADEAPAGPGVFLLSDSDLATAYYIESCQTLRVALGNLQRKDRGQHGGHGLSGSELRQRLAEHLGVNETKAAQYLAKHCVVRWIQLDDEAPHVAHFAIAVLKSPLNIE